MNICDRVQNLPVEILDRLKNANVFYEEEFYQYTVDSKTDVKYIYNETYLQVVVIHRIHSLFKTATLPTEPFPLSGEDTSFQMQQMFLDDLVTVLKNRFHVDWVTVTPASTLFQAYPSKSERIKFGNYVLDLTGSDDDTFNKITSKHRNMVRRGEKSGIEVKFGGLELLSDYIQVDAQTWQRSGKEINHTAFYRRYLAGFGDRALLGIAYKDGVPQCGILGIYNETMFYYMFGASADHPEPGSTHYLQWRTMQYLKERNVRSYNFVGCRMNVDAGSKYENIQRFKKGFGGDLIECYLFKVTMNRFKKGVFDALLYKRSGNAPRDVIDQEIEKWKEIN